MMIVPILGPNSPTHIHGLNCMAHLLKSRPVVSLSKTHVNKIESMVG